MAKITLAAYTVRIKELRAHPDGYEPIGNFAGNDLFPLFEQWVRRLDINIDNMQRILRTRVDTILLDGRTVAGLCESGDYGYEAEGINSSTGRLSYHRDIDDAEIIPFYFLAELPPDRRQGILLVQRFSQRGMKGPFASALSSEFQEVFPHRRLEIRPISSGRAWEQYLHNGTMKVVRFIRHDIPTTPEALLDPNGNWEGEGYTELAVHSGRGRPLPFGIDRLVRDGRPVTEIIELHEFPYDTVKVQIDLGGIQQTFDLGEPLGRMVLDISADVDLGPNGHPIFASIDGLARAYLTAIRAAMGQA